MAGKIVFLIMLILIAFLSAETVSATGLEYYGVESVIRDDNMVSSKVTLITNDSVSDLELSFGSEIRGLETLSEHDRAECSVGQSGEKVICRVNPEDVGEETQISFRFEIPGVIEQAGDEREFRLNYPIGYPVGRFFHSVYLPESASLKSSSNESFSPKYGSTVSDGKHIIIVWERQDVMEGDDLFFSISYQLPVMASYFYNIVIMIILASVILVSLGFFYLKTTRKASVKVIMPVLKGDEKRIVDILMENKGSAKQKLLVRETDFSKAKVSRLVSGLRERDILDVEHTGRTNRITLKLKK